MTNEEKLIELGYQENTLYMAIMYEDTASVVDMTEDILTKELYDNTGNIDCYDLQNYIMEMNTNGFDPMAEIMGFMFSQKDGFVLFKGYKTI